MDKSDNETRERAILDAAVDLFLHYGFDKTTVSDIARAAGVSKGAIYLHFESKEALFEALIARESAVYSRRWLALIAADPQGGTIGGMYKNILQALNESKFMASVFRQDGRIFGNYLRRPGNFFMKMRQSGAPSGRMLFVQMMQAAGVMRRDVDAAVVAHIMDMLAFGLVGMDEFIPREQQPATDDLIAGIAFMMDQAFTPPDADGERGKAIVAQIAAATEAQYAAQSKDTTE